MVVEINKPQLKFENNLKYEPQINLMAVIFTWARQLPKSEGGIIDLAAGYGIEAQELTHQGVKCYCQDASSRMVDCAVMPVKVNEAENLGIYPKNHFGGALLKDTLIFLSPQQREKMLDGLNRILISQGSLLIISEIETRYGIQYYQQKNNDITVGRNYQHFQTFSQLETYYQHLMTNYYQVEQILYKVSKKELANLAKKYHFQYTKVTDYQPGSNLALENRWTSDAGFIAVLTKKG